MAYENVRIDVATLSPSQVQGLESIMDGGWVQCNRGPDGKWYECGTAEPVTFATVADEHRYIMLQETARRCADLRANLADN